MATTGERYVEARRVLLEQAHPRTSQRHWIAAPEMSDEAVRSATGKGWDEWCDLIDQFDGRTEGHKAIVSFLRKDHGVGGWWTQGVTVGYERITGLRLPHQMADGTFTANKSRTVVVDANELRRVLLNDNERSHLFPDVPTELKSKPTSKAIRLAMAGGSASITFDDGGGGRTKVVVEHRGLGTFDAVEQWKFYWSDWLEAIDFVGRDS